MFKFPAGILLLASLACNESSSAVTNDKDTIMSTTETAMNRLDDKQTADGWQLLFDGKTTAGWHKYGGGPVGAAWKVADGNLYLDTVQNKSGPTDNGGNIVTDESFDNFHLKLEWKIAKNGNSGVLFYVQDDTLKYKEPWHTAPEMQVLDNEGHPDAKIIKHRAGDLYDLISSSKETVKKYGEWNAAEIKCVNGKLDLFLNGENVVSTQMWDDNWKKLVSGSKFSKLADFATFKTGRIGLQDHGNTVWYRNIMIKRL